MFSVEDLIAATGGVLQAGGPLETKPFKGVSIDSRALKRGEIFIAIAGKNFDGHDFIDEALSRGASCVVYSRQEKLKTFREGAVYIQVFDTLRALGALAGFHRRRFDIPVIAVTGSSGKTTTKEMIAWVLSGKYVVLKNKGTQNNLIGVPLTLLNICSKHDVCVVEMGTNRPGEIKQLTQTAGPTMGVVTNVGPAHLEFLGSLKGVYQEKIQLIKNLKNPGIAILNKADIILSKLSRVKSRPLFFFGVNRECEFAAAEITYHSGSVEFIFGGSHRIEIKHCALHNVSNALAAIGCGLLLGLDFNLIKERMEQFDSPDMRLKEIKLKSCVVFDDSYNSNPQSLKQAIDVLCRRQASGRRILVMGDMLELGRETQGFHVYFGRYISRKPIDILVTMGVFSRAAAESAKKNGMKTEAVCHFENCPSVLNFLHANIKEGDVLLVKGSRSLRMETIVEALKERH